MPSPSHQLFLPLLANRMRDAIQERFGKGPKPAAAEYLLDVMHTLLQVVSGGASVVHSLQSLIRELHIPDWIPGIGGAHRVEAQPCGSVEGL